MEFPDFHHANDTTPFPNQPHMLGFLHSYADYFDLNKHIKFSNLVIRVLPIENDKWEVIVRDLVNNVITTNTYDAVFVCNGHFFEPSMPQIQGANDFKGKMMHSHDFRTPDAFHGMCEEVRFCHFYLSLFCGFQLIN